VLFTPYLGLKLLPDFAKHRHPPESRSHLRHPPYNALRRLIDFCLRWRKSVVVVTVLMFIHIDCRASASCSSSSFPTSTRHRTVPRDAPA